MNDIDWKSVRKVLIVKLRSIGDTVLATPSLTALRRFLPDAQIDILLEDWVAPLLENFDGLDHVISVGPASVERLQVMRRLRREKYDVVFNLHGGTTSTFFTRATAAAHRVGWAEYQYAFLYNHLYSSSSEFWSKPKTHSAEQQLALLGFAGVPVEDRPKSRLTVLKSALDSLNKRFHAKTEDIGRFALIHPAAAFETKQWATANFARTVEYLSEIGLRSVAIAAKHESEILEKLESEANVSLLAFDDLSLSEITALASRAILFVGNDSGIAHIAAAVGTPSVVIFGSSNRDHWKPWNPKNDVPNEIVFEEFACQPCPGYECREFGEPRCILSVRPERVFESIQKLLTKK